MFTQSQRLGIGDGAIEVATNAIPQINGLTHIDHFAGLIFHEIAARFMRKVLENRLNMFGGSKRDHNYTCTAVAIAETFPIPLSTYELNFTADGLILLRSIIMGAG